LKYKAVVPFTGGRAALKYSTMKNGTVEPDSYTVTFHTNGGTPADFTQQVQSGGKATIPTQQPTREGYTFDVWYEDEALTKPYNFDSPVAVDLPLYARWNPLTFAVLLADMAANTNKTYTLSSDNETYNAEVTLTTANSPASVVIDGGDRAVTGSANRITIGTGVTITLKNITFKTLPFTVATSGTLVLDNGAVIRDNAGTGVTVNGESATAKETLEMRDGASVRDNTGGTYDAIYKVQAGGGVYVTGGEFKMSGGSISDNSAGVGGGVFMGGRH
jgi:uncharacterized repeat protein (TIGR02543 family)